MTRSSAGLMNLRGNILGDVLSGGPGTTVEQKCDMSDCWSLADRTS